MGNLYILKTVSGKSALIELFFVEEDQIFAIYWKYCYSKEEEGACFPKKLTKKLIKNIIKTNNYKTFPNKSIKEILRNRIASFKEAMILKKYEVN